MKQFNHNPVSHLGPVIAWGLACFRIVAAAENVIKTAENCCSIINDDKLIQ